MHYLEGRGDILFAFLHGSMADTAPHPPGPLSDLDLALFFREDPELLMVGSVVADLESITRKKVDVTILNGAERRAPAFCHRLFKQSKLLMCLDREAYVAFRRDSILFYLDVKPMREMVLSRLSKRVRQGEGGRRNYAGKN